MTSHCKWKIPTLGARRYSFIFLIGFLPTKTALGLQATKAGSGKTFGTKGPWTVHVRLYEDTSVSIFTADETFDFWGFLGVLVRFELVLFCPASLYTKKILTAAAEKDG